MRDNCFVGGGGGGGRRANVIHWRGGGVGGGGGTHPVHPPLPTTNENRFITILATGKGGVNLGREQFRLGGCLSLSVHEKIRNF